MNRCYLAALALAVGLLAGPARADVTVALYAGNPGGAGSGSATLDFSGLTLINQPFTYYSTHLSPTGAQLPFGVSFGVSSRTVRRRWTSAKPTARSITRSTAALRARCRARTRRR